MRVPFTKMHGCGNDYIYFNGFEQTLANPAALCTRLSNRRFGIGADGVIIILPSAVADARMQMFNADGSEGKMCGNGIRCVGKFLYEHGLICSTTVTVETLSGIKTLQLHLSGDTVDTVTVDMGAPVFEPSRIPVKLDGERVISRPVTVGGRLYTVTCVSMGNPHCIVFGGNPAEIPLETIGPAFEQDPLFPEKVNAEFVQVNDRRTLTMRVWERGSGETLACGTGACATVVAAVENGYCDRNEDITVHLRGGELCIRYTGDTVYMAGNAVTTFEGTVII